MSRLALTILAGLASSGCLGLFNDAPPPVPEGYPQLDSDEDGRAELVIDGDMYTTESGGGTTFNVEGGFEDQLRARTSFDYDLDLEYRAIDVGEYTARGGDLQASYDGLESGAACGHSSIKIVGRKTWDSGILGDQDVMWGVLSLQLCGTEYDSALGGELPIAREITGRFASVVNER